MRSMAFPSDVLNARQPPTRLLWRAGSRLRDERKRVTHGRGATAAAWRRLARAGTLGKPGKREDSGSRPPSRGYQPTEPFIALARRGTRDAPRAARPRRR